MEIEKRKERWKVRSEKVVTLAGYCDWPKKRMDRPSIFDSSREHFFFYHGSLPWF
jgi:hypothetical protein